MKSVLRQIILEPDTMRFNDKFLINEQLSL